MSNDVSVFKKNVFKAFRDGGIYLAFNILNRAIPFLLLPILTAYIDPYGYGVISLVALITSIAMPMLGLCSNTVLYQKYFKMDALEVGRFVNDCYKIIIANTFFVMIMAVLFSGVIERYLKIPLFWFQLGIFLAALGMAYTLTTTLFLLRKQSISYGVFQLVSILINVFLTLLLVVLLELSWQGRLMSLVVAGLIMVITSVVINVRQGDLKAVDFKSVYQGGSIVRLGGMLVPSAISGWAILMVDRVVLTSLTTLEILGIYAIGLMIAQLTDIFLASLSRAFQPYLFEYGSASDMASRIKIVQGMYLFVVVALFTAGAVFVIAPIIVELMIDDRYSAAVDVIGWLSLSFAFFNIGSVFLNLILLVEKNWLTIYVGIICIATSVVASYLLIGAYGMKGAAISNSLTAFVYMFLLFVGTLKYNRFPWFDKRVLSFSVG